MEKLEKPKTHLTEVLYHLIKHKKVSVESFDWMSGYRTRVSELELQYGLILNEEYKKFISKYGNKSCITIHVLPDSLYEKAVSIYKNLTEIKQGKPRSFTDLEVLKIRQSKYIKKQVDLANKYKCSVALISKIQNNIIYKNV